MLRLSYLVTTVALKLGESCFLITSIKLMEMHMLQLCEPSHAEPSMTDSQSSHRMVAQSPLTGFSLAGLTRSRQMHQ